MMFCWRLSHEVPVLCRTLAWASDEPGDPGPRRRVIWPRARVTGLSLSCCCEPESRSDSESRSVPPRVPGTGTGTQGNCNFRLPRWLGRLRLPAWPTSWSGPDQRSSWASLSASVWRSGCSKAVAAAAAICASKWRFGRGYVVLPADIGFAM